MLPPSLLQTAAFLNISKGVVFAEPLLSFAAAGAGSLMGPYLRDMEYSANRVGPQATPTPDAVLRLYWAGFFGPPTDRRALEHAQFLLNEYGVHFEGDTDITQKRSRAWQSYFSLARPMPDLNTILHANRFGGFGIGDDYVQMILQRQGIFEQKHVDLFTKLPEKLDFELIFRLWASGIIDEVEVIRLLTINGQVNEVQRNWLLELFEVPSLAESFILRNRGIIDDGELDNYIARNGFRRNEERDRLAKLRFEIPGPSDLVRFAVRHVFERTLVERFGFDEELSPSFKKYIDMQGFGSDFQIQDPDTGDMHNVPIANAFWEAHWVWPAPTQAYTMLHRLRPTGGENGGPRSKSGLVFTQNDLNYLLRGNDYPKHWRPYLADISFRVIEAQQVKELYNTGIIDGFETIERYQDAGYKFEDASLLFQLNVNENKWKQIQRSQSRMRFKAINAYRLGTIDRSEAEVMLYELALPTLSMYEEYKVKPLQEKIDIAHADDATQVALNSVDIDAAATVAKTAISAIKKAYLHLEIDAQTAQNALVQIGVTQNRVTQYIDKWKWEFFGRGKTLAVGQILKAVVRGYMLPQVAVQRLVLLGYSNVDAFALVNMANEDRIAYVTRAQVSLARSRAAQQRALLSLNKNLKIQLRENQALLARSASRAKLVKWFVDEHIPESEFRLRLSLLGVSKEDIEHEYQEAIAKRSSKSQSKKTAKTGP